MRSVNSHPEVRVYEDLGKVRVTITRRDCDWLQVAVGNIQYAHTIVLTHEQARLLASKLTEVCDQWEAEYARWKRMEPQP